MHECRLNNVAPIIMIRKTWPLQNQCLDKASTLLWLTMFQYGLHDIVAKFLAAELTSLCHYLSNELDAGWIVGHVLEEPAEDAAAEAMSCHSCPDATHLLSNETTPGWSYDLNGPLNYIICMKRPGGCLHVTPQL